MKRFICVLLTLAMIICALPVCVFAEEEAETRVVTDLAGNEVTVPVNPQRIAVLPDALCTLSWILMGGGDRMACLIEESKGDWENYLGHVLYPDMEDIPAGSEQNAEELAALEPDLIITMSGDYLSIRSPGR